MIHPSAGSLRLCLCDTFFPLENSSYGPHPRAPPVLCGGVSTDPLGDAGAHPATSVKGGCGCLAAGCSPEPLWNVRPADNTRLHQPGRSHLQVLSFQVWVSTSTSGMCKDSSGKKRKKTSPKPKKPNQKLPYWK